MVTTKRTRNFTNSSDKPADKSVKLDICVTCHNSISGDCIVCCWCEQWEHRACANIKQSEFVMLESPSKNILFFCSFCAINVPKTLTLFTNQSEFNGKFEAKFQSMENNLSQKITDIEAKLRDYHNTVLGACDTTERGLHSQLQEHSHSPISDDSVANITLSLTSEQKEKDKRQFNIVLHNLKESDATDSATRKQKDIESCCSLFSTYLNVSASIKTAIRLGKKDSRPCRLLKLTLSSLDEKAKILKRKLKLKADQNPEHIRKIFISPDLTPLEQRRNNTLRKQLADMNKVQNIYVIRKGQIVRKHGSDASAHASMSPPPTDCNDNGSRTAS